MKNDDTKTIVRAVATLIAMIGVLTLMHFGVYIKGLGWVWIDW